MLTDSPTENFENSIVNVDKRSCEYQPQANITKIQ